MFKDSFYRIEKYFNNSLGYFNLDYFYSLGYNENLILN